MCATGTRTAISANAVWYRGYTRDAAAGSYQLGTRTYQPGIAGFTTPDTHRVSAPSTDLSVGTDPLTANTYTYVNGNPVNAYDPTGHWPEWLEKTTKAAKGLVNKKVTGWKNTWVSRGQTLWNAPGNFVNTAKSAWSQRPTSISELGSTLLTAAAGASTSVTSAADYIAFDLPTDPVGGLVRDRVFGDNPLTGAAENLYEKAGIDTESPYFDIGR